MFRMLIGGYKMDIPKIYNAMANVQQYMVENPIGKNDENKFQKYKYRGIETVVQAFSKPLKENQIILLPQEVKVSTRYKNEKTSLTRITGSLRFVCLEDGSYLERSYEGHSESTQGKDLEAAKSFAYRDALLETFCVPFEQVEPETTDEENEEQFQEPALIDEFKKDLEKAGTKKEKVEVFKNYDKAAELEGDEETRVKLNLIYSKEAS
tara:strand:- start:271 stop:897 length:627 start_codon:yes stop_codon:yes gene_type:complete